MALSGAQIWEEGNLVIESSIRSTGQVYQQPAFPGY
jgi:hypothetical protein